MDEFDESMPQQDSMVRKFYERISNIANNWVTIEDKYYRNIEMGDLELKECALLSEHQTLDYFYYAQARNGGPIAFLTKEFVLLVGQKTPKNQIFLLDCYGKKYKTIFLDKLVKNLANNTKWVLLAFNADEDLILMNHEGRIFIIDIIEGQLLGENYIKLQNGDFSDSKNLIDDAKYENNAVVFRTRGYRFHYIQNVGVQTLGQTAIPLFTSSALQQQAAMMGVSEPEQFIVDVTEKGGMKVKVWCTDPKEGVHEISEYKTLHHTVFYDPSGNAGIIGKVKCLALSEKKKWMVVYFDSDSTGTIIVLRDQVEVARQETYKLGGTGITICGNEQIQVLLNLPSSVVIVGPQSNEEIDLSSEAQGIVTTPEIDGIRICSATKTYFLEMVSQSTQDLFELAGTKPPQTLRQAQRYVDIKSPKAEELIRDLGNDLNIGIEGLLDAAKYEHKDIDVLKFIIRTASFAKKFSDPTQLDPNIYVETVKHSIVLTAMRYSKIFPRAITYTQFENFKAKNVVRILLKYRDYKLAIKLADQLNKRNLLSSIYEDWCCQMLQYSNQGEDQIIKMFNIQFQDLAYKMAIDQGFSFSEVEAMKIALQQEDSDKAKIMQWIDKIKIQLDFTKLAKIAHQKNKKKVSNYLIAKEKHIVKKIPFMLEVKEFGEALRIAVEGGDPNNINKVFLEIIKSKKSKEAPQFKAVIDLAFKIEGGLRHLRNFAKKRHDLFILREIYEFQQQLKNDKDIAQTGLKQGDLSEVTEIFKESYYQENYPQRKGLFQRANESATRIKQNLKEEFTLNTVGEMSKMLDIQEQKFKEEKGNYNIDCTLSACLGHFISKESKEGDNFCASVQKSFKISDLVYHTIIVRGFAKKKLWPNVSAYITQQNPPCPFAIIGEICDEFENKEMAQTAFIKIKKVDERIQALIEFKYWTPAIEQIFSNKKEEEFLDELLGQKDLPLWARDDVRRRQQFQAAQGK